MTKIEDFESAPVGATATTALGSRAMKMDSVERGWVTPSGNHFSDEGMVNWGYTLDSPAPTTTREALDIAWELAYPVREGQAIPKGTRYLEDQGSGLKENRARYDFNISAGSAPGIRTLKPLPEPEPDWLDAPAVLARLKTWIPEGDPIVFTRYTHDHDYWLTIDPPAHHWSELEYVTPLYPKGQDR